MTTLEIVSMYKFTYTFIFIKGSAGTKKGRCVHKDFHGFKDKMLLHKMRDTSTCKILLRMGLELFL